MDHMIAHCMRERRDNFGILHQYIILYDTISLCCTSILSPKIRLQTTKAAQKGQPQHTKKQRLIYAKNQSVSFAPGMIY